MYNLLNMGVRSGQAYLAEHFPCAWSCKCGYRSRCHLRSNTEWQFSLSFFKHVVNRIEGLVDIDIMASWTSCQVSTFVSQQPDQESVAVNCSTINWSSLMFWSFPPFSLILWVLMKVREYEATGMLVVPNCPPPPGYPQVMHLLIDWSRPHIFFQRSQDPLAIRKPPTGNPYTIGQTRTPSLPLIKQKLEEQGVSKQTADIILAAWQLSTTRQHAL